MDIASLKRAYRTTERMPVDTVCDVYDRIDATETNAWINTRSREAVVREARTLSGRDPSTLPLYGVPFAVKDNIDYDGLPTTAGCPAYSYDPEESSHVVDRLVEAGALLVGKTNMDQFATGLVGTRTPYGICRNPSNDAYIAGGSSAGSAVAVAHDHVAFALGTDTAGSGRVPAAFCGLVGLKPTRGVLSTSGVVPACRTLDCVSVFANTVADALAVERVAAGHDPSDQYSRPRATDLQPSLRDIDGLRVGIPPEAPLEFFGDTEAAQLYDEAVTTMRDLPVTVDTIDFEPFVRTASLLYEGPWVAERYAAVGEFLTNHPEDVHPVVKEIIDWGADYSAVETFEAMYDLQYYKRRAERVLSDVDVLLTPTTGTIYTVDEIQEKPIERNSNLGYYTNFVNLLDLSAVSVPVGSWEDGPAFGVTLFGDAFAEGMVASVADRLRAASA